MKKRNKNVFLIADIHLGARNASLTVAEYQIKFFEDQFFPAVKKHKITEVICLGDLFDVRQHVNTRVFEMWKERVFDVMQEMGITFHVIVGNHDSSLKNSISVNSPRLFLSHYPNIIIHDKPLEVDIGVNRFLFSPWICSDNYEETMNAVAASKCSVIMGHFEFGGFEMYKGQVMHEGLDQTLFDKFKYVFSGHYHHKSDNGSIYYLGSPFEFTWADYDDPRGYHIFDTESLELTYVKNTSTSFIKLHYDDDEKGPDYWKTFDCDSLAGKYLKLMVVKKTDEYQFNRLLEKLYNSELGDFKIIEDMTVLDADSVDDDDIELGDSASLLESYIDAIDINEDKEKLKRLVRTLYISALNQLE